MLKQEITDAVVKKLDDQYEEYFGKINDMAADIAEVTERLDNVPEELGHLVHVDQYDEVVSDIEDITKDIEWIKAEMTREMAIVNRKIAKVDLFKSKTTYDFELENLTAFFKTGSDFMSEYFYCQGKPIKSFILEFVVCYSAFLTLEIIS